MKQTLARFQWALLALLLCFSAASFAATGKPNPELDRLNASLSALDIDPALANLGAVERFKARQAVTQLASA